MEYNSLIPLISLGFFGGFSHCSGMCGPFVLTQVGNRLQKTDLKNFSNFAKLKNLALLPYHLGRITTYCLIGFCCSFFSQEVFYKNNFRFVAAIFLLFAALFFLDIFFNNNLFSKFKKIFLFKHKKPQTKIYGFLKNFMAFLWQNPQGFNGYLLGIILGFIPCGLLYGAFLIAAATPSPLFAALGMFLFGIATFPALFLTAAGGYLISKTRIINFSQLAKIAAAINVALLLMMAYKLIVM